MDILQEIEMRKEEIFNLYHTLHAMPEVGFQEIQTSQFLAQKLEKAGMTTKTKINGTTGVVGILKGQKPGPVICLRADMDALAFKIDGNDVNIHACGHDANSTIVLMAALVWAKWGIKSGTLKILFQPAEEVLGGALAMLKSDLLADVEEMFGIHLRPIQEAKFGQATPALCHGASYIMEAEIKGLAAHGARPHLAINVIDAAAAVVNAVNAIRLNPTVPFSVKTTKLLVDNGANNIIPDRAEMVFDLRAQTNEAMEELQKRVHRAVKNGAAALGASSRVSVLGGVPGANYDQGLIDLTSIAIQRVLGETMNPVITPGGEDFHYYSTKGQIKTAYIGLGADLTPGLHHPEMKFDLEALIHGVKILAAIVEERLG